MPFVSPISFFPCYLLCLKDDEWRLKIDEEKTIKL